jgi:hypothetical protein
MYNGLAVLWSESQQWLQACHVEREMIHGGSFTGNSCKILLSKVDLLEELCPESCKVYVNAFRSFGKVVSSCYGDHLDSTFESYITEFKEAYLQLGISVTPKIHAVFYHVAEFCKSKRKGLGQWGEQASESVHHDFGKVWNNFKVNSLDNPHFGERLLRAVQVYNSRHT